MEKKIALCTAIKWGKNYKLYTGLTALDIHELFIDED
jgi:hypothetical protein